MISLMKLSGLHRAPVRVVARAGAQSKEEAEGVDMLRFDLGSVAKEIFEPLKRSLLCKIEAQTDILVKQIQIALLIVENQSSFS